MDYSPLGSSVHRIFLARILEWVAMPSSRGSSRPRDPTQTEPDDFNVTVVATNVSLIFDLALDFIGSKLSWWLAAAAAKSLQSCPTLRPHRWQPTRLPHPRDSPGKNTGVGCHLLLQCMKVKSESEVPQSCPTARLSATPWTAAYQAPQSMGFSRHEYWSGLPLPSPSWWLSGKESACSAADAGLVPGSGRSPGEENGYPLQYPLQENSMDRGVWQATVHGVTNKEMDSIEWLTHSYFLTLSLEVLL